MVSSGWSDAASTVMDRRIKGHLWPEGAQGTASAALWSSCTTCQGISLASAVALLNCLRCKKPFDDSASQISTRGQPPVVSKGHTAGTAVSLKLPGFLPDTSFWVFTSCTNILQAHQLDLICHTVDYVTPSSTITHLKHNTWLQCCA